PGKVAAVVDVEGIAPVAHHVHVLVGKALVGDVLVAELDDQLLGVAPKAQGQGVVLGAVEGVEHLVAVAVPVAFRLIPGAVVGEAPALSGEAGVGGDTAAVAVAPRQGREGPGLAQPFAGTGVEGRGGVQGDGAADAVAAEAHRGDARHHLHRADATGIQVGEGGVHVVGAGGGDRKSTRLNSSHVKNSYAVF